MKTTEEVLNQLLEEGYTLTEIMCSVNKMESQLSKGNNSLNSVAEQYAIINAKNNG